MRRFSNVVKTAALKIKRKMRKVEFSKAVTEARKLIVFHFRTTDRGCVSNRLSPARIVDKLISLGAHRQNTTLYLMTDAGLDNQHVKALKQYYSPFFFRASDMGSVFEKIPFRNNGYLVFAVELELQNISDGFILTYGGPKLQENGKTLGVLNSGLCDGYYFGVNDTLMRTKANS